MFNIEKLLKTAHLISINNNPAASFRLHDGSTGTIPPSFRFNSDTGLWSILGMKNEELQLRFFDSTEHELFAHDFYRNLNSLSENYYTQITYNRALEVLRNRILKYNERYYLVDFKEDKIKIYNSNNSYRIQKDSTNIYTDDGKLVIFNGILEPRYFEIHSTKNTGIK